MLLLLSHKGAQHDDISKFPLGASATHVLSPLKPHNIREDAELALSKQIQTSLPPSSVLLMKICQCLHFESVIFKIGKRALEQFTKKCEKK